MVVTGAGPHSGDAEVGYRFDVDPWLMAKAHAASVWAFVAVLVAILVLLRRSGVRGRPWTAALVLLAVTLGQGLIGYVQLFTGLPIALVNLHMLGAALLTTAVTFFVGTTRTRGPAERSSMTPARPRHGAAIGQIAYRVSQGPHSLDAWTPRSPHVDSSRRTAPSPRSTASTSRCPRAPCSACSARTGQARPPSSGCSAPS